MPAAPYFCAIEALIPDMKNARTPEAPGIFAIALSR
jgi:hypothetical protein